MRFADRIITPLDYDDKWSFPRFRLVTPPAIFLHVAAKKGPGGMTELSSKWLGI